MYDVVIIGGGPAGLYFSYKINNEFNYLLVEKSSFLGGQCNFYKHKSMYDVMGIGVITGEQYIDLLQKNIDKKNIILKNSFIKFQEEENHVCVYTCNQKYTSKFLVISEGHGTVKFRKPIIKDLEKYENKQIFYFPEDPSILVNKKILIFGGGDSALDAVDLLLPFTPYITLIHRRNIFNAQEGKLKLLKKIKTYIGYFLKSLNGNDISLNSITIKNNNEEISIPVDYVFFCYGYDISDHNSPYDVDIDTMLVKNYSRVFAIGACSQYENKRDLISSNIFETEIVLSQIKKK
ncbi:hypothetical protein AB836_00140 [Rickettsiales bacterium (ex Bugula neritina AB1)]|nr:hypothetical protein AB836_00140 [Rickettsiales bacterium (ex Bugula neritina AB1)]